MARPYTHIIRECSDPRLAAKNGANPGHPGHQASCTSYRLLRFCWLGGNGCVGPTIIPDES